MSGRIPVVLDTDIGSDIDDTWALLMMLRCPELEPRLVVSSTGDTVLRAKLTAKLLEAAGRTDVPVGVGVETDMARYYPQEPWAVDYDLASYPGTVHEDGVQALIDCVMESEERVTLICIGPVPNIREALRREPRIAERARFVGMHGSFNWSHHGESKAIAEYNVVKDAAACQAAFAAPWAGGVTITPLDTCARVVLDGELYQQVATSADPVMKTLIENYRYWARAANDPDRVKARSSVLFDTVAVYLAFAEELLEIEELPVRVTDDGWTRVEEGAKQIRVAMAWRDLEAFKRLLVERLLGG